MLFGRFLFCAVCFVILTGCQGTTILAVENSSDTLNAASESGEEFVEILPPERPQRFVSVSQEMPPTHESQFNSVPQIGQAQEEQRAPPRQVEAQISRPVSKQEIVSQANLFFNSFKTLTGSFLQQGNDGRRQQGQVYLLRPGRMRFDYNSPSALQIISDGQSVAVRNTQSGRQDIYPVSQTPLKFLLRSEIRLDNDLKLLGTKTTKDNAILTLEDRSALGGTARITLYFDPMVTSLQRWDVEDAQRNKTTVMLSGLQFNGGISPEYFVIPMKTRD